MQTNTKTIIFLGLVSTLLTFGANITMAQAKEVVLSSPIKGQLLDNGVPVEGKTIRRTVTWKKLQSPKVDFSVTTSDGFYEFPSIKVQAKFNWLDALFHHPGNLISLRLIEGNEITLLAVVGRDDYELGSETGFPEIEITSDLSLRRKSEISDFFQVESKIKRKD